MVHTRGQKAKEENEIKLAKQQSLAEQSQEVFVSTELPHELEAAPVLYQDISRQKIREQHIVKQNLAAQHIAEQAVTEQAVFKRAVIKQSIAEHDSAGQDVVQQDIFDEVSARLVSETSASDSNLVEYVGSASRPCVEHVQSPVKTETKETSSVKIETGDLSGVNDISTQLGDEMPSEVKTSQEKNSANLTSLLVFSENDRSLPASGSELSKKYFLRNRVEKAAEIPSLQAVESTVALTAPKNHVIVVTDSDDDLYTAARDAVDEPADMPNHHNEKGEEGNDTYQPRLTRKRNTQRKGTPQKTATRKTTPKQKPTDSRVTSKIKGGLALRLTKIVTDKTEVDIPLNQKAVHTKDHKAFRKSRSN
jgi:hypothetical protein